MTIHARAELAPDEIKEGMVIEMLGISKAGRTARRKAVRWPGWEGRTAEVLHVDRCWVWLKADFDSAGIKKQYFAKDYYDFALVEKAASETCPLPRCGNARGQYFGACDYTTEDGSCGSTNGKRTLACGDERQEVHCNNIEGTAG